MEYEDYQEAIQALERINSETRNLLEGLTNLNLVEVRERLRHIREVGEDLVVYIEEGQQLYYPKSFKSLENVR